MTNTTATVAVPENTASAVAAAATGAAERIALTLASATEASALIIRQAYGADVKRQHVTLAGQSAREAAGIGKPSRGGARAAVLSVLSYVADALASQGEGATPTEALYVAGAQAHYAAEKKSRDARTAQKKSLVDTLLSSDSDLDTRAAALDTLSGMQSQDDNARKSAAADALTSAVNRALNLLPADEVNRIVAAALESALVPVSEPVAA